MDANRRYRDSQDRLFDFVKFSSLVMNCVIFLLLVAMLISEIVIHVREDFLRDRVITTDPIEDAFAKSGCETVFATTAIFLFIPLVGAFGLCIDNVFISAGYASLMLIVCVISAFILPYGYVMCGLMLATSIIAMFYVRVLRERQLQRVLDQQMLNVSN